MGKFYMYGYKVNSNYSWYYGSGTSVKQRDITEVCVIDTDSGEVKEISRIKLIEYMSEKKIKLENVTLRNGRLCCIGSRLEDYPNFSLNSGKGEIKVILVAVTEDRKMFKILNCNEGRVEWIEKEYVLGKIKGQEWLGLNIDLTADYKDLEYPKKIEIVKNKVESKNSAKYRLLGGYVNIVAMGDKLGLNIDENVTKNIDKLVVPEETSIILKNCFCGLSIGSLIINDSVTHIYEGAFRNCFIGELVINVGRGKKININGKLFDNTVIQKVIVNSDNRWDEDNIGFNLCGADVLDLEINGGCSSRVLQGIRIRDFDPVKYGFTVYEDNLGIYIDGMGKLSLNIPDYVTEIGKDVFKYDYSIRDGFKKGGFISKLVFGKNLKRLGSNAFNGFTAREVIIENGSFEYGKILDTFSIERLVLDELDEVDNMPKSISYLNRLECNLAVIPGGVTRRHNGYKTKWNFSSRLAKIEGNALYSLDISWADLRGVELQDRAINECHIRDMKVSSNKGNKGLYCNYIENLMVDYSNGGIYDLGYGNLIENLYVGGNKMVEGIRGDETIITNLYVANGVKTIGVRAFANKDILEIKFNRDLERICDSAFRGNRIEKVTVGKNVVIEDGAFDRGVKIIRV